jgi:hypothetical protein
MLAGKKLASLERSFQKGEGAVVKGRDIYNLLPLFEQRACIEDWLEGFKEIFSRYVKRANCDRLQVIIGASDFADMGVKTDRKLAMRAV